MLSQRARLSSRVLALLLVEDDDDLRELLHTALAEDGSTVVSVCDGESAEKILQNGPRPDVVVTDVRMPRRSGIELLRNLRRRGDSIPVILITAFGEAVDRAEVGALGSAAVIEKPFDIDDLQTALMNLELLTRKSQNSTQTDPIAKSDTGNPRDA